MPNSDWVLKIGVGKYGFEANLGEIEISKGNHGLGARDIFINVYDYDKGGFEPYWLICEKVVPLAEISDLEILKRSFPTFWNMIAEEDMSRVTDSKFKYILDGVFGSVAYHINKSSGSDSSIIFYNAMKNECLENKLNCVDFKQVVFYEDFKRLCSAFAYISSNDLHDGNFGLTSLNNPGPESIVILDFSTDAHI